MLAKMVYQNDSIVEHMLQSMLDNLQETEASDKDSSASSENMLVFQDLDGQVWQISKVNDPMDFDELFDEAENETHFFLPTHKEKFNNIEPAVKLASEVNLLTK